MRLANFCPYCLKRRYLFTEGEGKYRYKPKKLIKDMWKDIFGVYPLGKFWKARCELCHRNLAVFREHQLSGMRGKPIVLFLCSLTDLPVNKEECDKHKSCYYCPIPKIQQQNNKRMWSG